MRVERRIVLTKKEYEAIKIVYNITGDIDVFDCGEDIVDFLEDCVRGVDYQEMTIEVED